MRKELHNNQGRETTMKTKLVIAVFGLMLGAATASADEGVFTAAKMLDATKLAIDDFTAENPTHAEHLTGFKSWKSGHDARVRLYVTHDASTMEFNFTCHEHDEGIECHAQ